MSERWESSCSKSVKFVSKHLNLLRLLLSDIQELSLMSDVLDLFAWVSITIVLRVRLQVHDLLTRVNVVLESTGLVLKLL